MIEGYDDGKIAVFTKMHHATVDGVSGANLVSHLCALEPDAEPLALDADEEHGRYVGSRELFGRAIVSNLTRPVDGGQAGRPDQPACSRRRSAAPAPAPRWRRR